MLIICAQTYIEIGIIPNVHQVHIGRKRTFLSVADALALAAVHQRQRRVGILVSMVGLLVSISTIFAFIVATIYVNVQKSHRSEMNGCAKSHRHFPSMIRIIIMTIAE